MSFQITLKSNRKAAARFIGDVRRAILKAYTEEQKASGLTQTDIARAIGVHRSVINRELRGQKDLTLGRVAELAWALGRNASINFPKKVAPVGSNILLDQPPAAAGSTNNPIDFDAAPIDDGSAFEATTEQTLAA